MYILLIEIIKLQSSHENALAIVPAFTYRLKRNPFSQEQGCGFIAVLLLATGFIA